MNEVIKFKVGSVYTCRSICDYHCRWEFEVVKRTDKRITIKGDGKIKTVGIATDYSGQHEVAFPMGKYSMAPVIKAA